MLDLLVPEAHEGFERHLVAQIVIARLLEHVRADEALHQPEEIGIRAALHVAQGAALRVRQEHELVDHREAIGKELVVEVEHAAAQDVAVDLPGGFLRGLDDAGVARSLGARRGQRGGGSVHEGPLLEVRR
jgi:hypothetical protein